VGVPRPIRITEQFAEDTLDRKGRQSVISLSVMGVLLATMVGCGYSGSTGHQSRPSLSPPNENMPRTLPNSLRGRQTEFVTQRCRGCIPRMTLE